MNSLDVYVKKVLSKPVRVVTKTKLCFQVRLSITNGYGPAREVTKCFTILTHCWRDACQLNFR